MQDYETDFPSPELHLDIRTGSHQVAELINKGLALGSEKQIDEAIVVIDQAIQMERGNPSLYFLVARYLLDKHLVEPARDAIEKAVFLNKQEPNYLKLQGDIYGAAGLTDKAIASYKRSLKLDSRLVTALNNLGDLYRQQNRKNEARKYLSRALANAPDFVPARFNLAQLLIDNGDSEQAEKELNICIDQAPQVPDPWFSLVNIRENTTRGHEAVELMEAAVEASPDNAQVRLQLIAQYEKSGQIEKAMEHYPIVDQLEPKIGQDHETLSIYYMNALEQPLAQRFADSAARLNQAHVRNHLFLSHYLAVLDADSAYENHRTWSAQQSAAREQQFDHSTRNHDTDRRLKIGFVSPDYHAHAVSFFIQSILENLDRNKFEVFCYANMKVDPDKVTELIKDLTDHWREIQDFSDFEAARVIFRDEVDILIDLSGHTRDSRVSLFAYKPAPVQAAYLGYPGSTGLAEMDYWITDHLIHPEDTPEPSAETKYRLNRCWCSYSPPKELPPIAAKPAGAPITFGVINHIGKHSAAFVDLWGRILDRVPGSRLMVKSVEFRNTDLRIKVLDRLERQGIDRSRILLLGQTRTHADHLRVYNNIDVCLDPFPYNGGTSTTDAIAMGTPVVSLTGDSLKTRMGLSILTAAGHPEWVTYDLDAYLETAVALAESGITAKVKQTIRDEFLQSEITDGIGLAKELERAYLDIWQRYSEKPGTL